MCIHLRRPAHVLLHITSMRPVHGSELFVWKSRDLLPKVNFFYVTTEAQRRPKANAAPCKEPCQSRTFATLKKQQTPQNIMGVKRCALCYLINSQTLNNRGTWECKLTPLSDHSTADVASPSLNFFKDTREQIMHC